MASAYWCSSSALTFTSQPFCSTNLKLLPRLETFLGAFPAFDVSRVLLLSPGRGSKGALIGEVVQSLMLVCTACFGSSEQSSVLRHDCLMPASSAGCSVQVCWGASWSGSARSVRFVLRRSVTLSDSSRKSLASSAQHDI